jgi:hypothetical protein
LSNLLSPLCEGLSYGINGCADLNGQLVNIEEGVKKSRIYFGWREVSLWIYGYSKGVSSGWVSLSDPESRIMKQGGSGGYGPSYNMQVSTDAGHKIIAGVGVSQAGADDEELQDAERRIEDNLGRPAGQWVVDKGL